MQNNENEITKVFQLRAITVEQKRDILNRILSVWMDNPSQRLGQLLANSLSSNKCEENLFFIEDEILIQMVEATFLENKND